MLYQESISLYDEKKWNIKPLDVVRGEDLFLLPLRKRAVMGCVCTYEMGGGGGGGRAKFEISTVYCV